MNIIEELEIINKEEQKRNARKSHLEFMQYTWAKTEDDPLLIGFHTEKICQRIDKAFEDLRKGKSTFLIINTHHRTGKSDMVSRYLSPHFLGEFPDKECMQITYQANLSSSFSTFGRNILKSQNYRELYPDIYLSRETNKKNDWVICNDWGFPTGGRLYASGIRSGLTGNGFHLGIVDDWFSGRKEAESKVMRDNVWRAFTDDFMTRRAPVSIVMVIGTSWHWDGLIGRLRKQQEEDLNFPRFEEMIFPAKSKDYKGPEKYPNEYLFMERFNKKWYKEQYATLGIYSAKALMDCDPTRKEGALLSTAGIIFHNPDDPAIPNYRKLKRAQIWDMAHTAEERTGDDPDWTSGTELAFEKRPGDPVPHLWVFDRVRFRENAPERDRKIKLHTKMKGHYVIHAIESSIDAKDAYHYLKTNIPDYKWEKIDCGKLDKAIRALPLEPIFEAPKHVHVIRGSWNKEWIEEVETFDGSGKDHDDGIDNITAGYILLVEKGVKIDNKTKEELAKRRRVL